MTSRKTTAIQTLKIVIGTKSNEVYCNDELSNLQGEIATDPQQIFTTLAKILGPVNSTMTGLMTEWCGAHPRGNGAGIWEII